MDWRVQDKAIKPIHPTFNSLFNCGTDRPMATHTKKLLEVQMLRFLAATMVLFGHTQHEIATRPSVSGGSFVEFSPIFWAGGVDIFFVISGFIMYHLSQFEFGTYGASCRFLLRRLARIVPPYWLFTTAMLAAIVLFPAQVTHNEIDPLHIVSSYAFFPIQNPYGRFYPVLILGWTINFEIMFYVVFAAALFFRRPIGVALIIVLLGFAAFIGFFDKPRVGPFAFWCDPIVVEFLFGILLAHLRSRGLGVSTPACLALFLAGLAAMAAAKSLGFANAYWPYRALWMGGPALLICAGPMLIRQSQSIGPLARFAAYGGDASYALYLSHPFSISLVALLSHRVPGLTGWTYFAAAFIVSMTSAFLVYHFIEQPLTHLAQTLMKRLEAIF